MFDPTIQKMRRLELLFFSFLLVFPIMAVSCALAVDFVRRFRAQKTAEKEVSIQMVNRSSLMGEDFLDKLGKLNEEKSADSPYVVILQAKADHTGAISGSEARFFYWRLAQTHRVVLKMVDSIKRQGNAFVADAYHELQKAPECIILHGHGTEEGYHVAGIRFGRGEEGIYNSNNAQPGDLSCPGLNAAQPPVVLLACKTGILGCCLSDILSRDVWAVPNQAVSARLTELSYCNQHRRMELRTCLMDGKQNACCYQSKIKSTPVCSKKDLSKLNREYFSYLQQEKKQAS